MSNGWQDMIVGARMTVDQTFAERVRASELSRQQWGLVMTAVEFEVENAEDPEMARIVADTSKLEHVVPEMQSVDDQMNQMAGGGGGGRSGGGGGMVDGIKSALGIGGGDDGNEELAATAASLAQEYAEELQSHLENEGRWDEVRRAAKRD
ncbi:DUF5799 family protein [Halobacterium zhouii]|uniref:DUF5799 family protein n=1 Tax=Halobacterium zhouii TaxID=2902624 RepID=UPI001E5C887A|nr:DUF5799 family protein [Halobacterium zhouii]